MQGKDDYYRDSLAVNMEMALLEEKPENRSDPLSTYSLRMIKLTISMLPLPMQSVRF
jgi:hypothetical protein